MPIPGLEAARHFVRLNAANVILAVRTISKGEAAAADISSALSTSKTRIAVWQVDLSNYDSIRSFAERVKTLDRLDAVVQNAGILTTKFSLAEGQESTVTVNVIGTVLLALSVLPKLQESAAKYKLQGRMTFVGSDLIYIAKFKEKDASGTLFDALKVKEGVDMDDRSVQNASSNKSNKRIPSTAFPTPRRMLTSVINIRSPKYSSCTRFAASLHVCPSPQNPTSSSTTTHLVLARVISSATIWAGFKD